MKGFDAGVVVELVRTDLALGRKPDLEPVFALAEETLTLRETLTEEREKADSRIEELEDKVSRLQDSLGSLLLILDEVEHEELDKYQQDDVDAAWRLRRE